MSFFLIFGGLIYHFFREGKSDIENLGDYPMVSILLPCHNEESCIAETIQYLLRIDYPDYEIIAIDDGSKDKTPQILEKLSTRIPQLRVIRLTSNRGKGTALTMGALSARAEYLVCIDADAILDKKAVKYFIWHFLKFPRVGAITGNPRVRNRTSLLGKIQVGEFSSIVGMIKRTQRVLGKIFTVSGVVAAFRKRALLSVGFWSNDMVTEDIDVSWKLQLRFWNIHYEPRALCWILMPETFQGFWRQRLRWAQGGSEVLKKYRKAILDWRQRRIWPIYLEYCLSIFWAYAFWLTVFMFLLGRFFDLPANMVVRSILPGWTGVILAMICLTQLIIGLLVDSQFEKGMYKLFFWLIWYPMIYWLVNALVTIIAFPLALFKRKGTLAVWEHPDRGLA